MKTRINLIAILTQANLDPVLEKSKEISRRKEWEKDKEDRQAGQSVMCAHYIELVRRYELATPWILCQEEYVL